MYQFVESIRIENGQIYAIDFHNDRMNRTRVHFWEDCTYLDIESFLTDIPMKGLYKCRVVYAKEILKIEYIPYSLHQVHSLKIVHSETIDYTYKSTDRTDFKKLSMQKENADDILIVKHGFLTDTSIGNIALFNGTDWITPDTPLLEGIHRRALLQSNQIKTGSITENSLWHYQKLRIFNAMIDFGELELPINEHSIIK